MLLNCKHMTIMTSTLIIIINSYYFDEHQSYIIASYIIYNFII